MPKKLIPSKCIENFKKIHKDKYDYSEFEYKKCRGKGIIICKIHGKFLQSYECHYYKKHGCYECGKKTISQDRKSNTFDFIKKVTKIHGDKYDYSKVTYTNNDTKVIIKCHEHGEFLQNPQSHLDGSGCPKCKNVSVPTKDELLEKFNKIHKNKYNYPNLIYNNSVTKIEITCPKHGSFFQEPYSHLRGCGCPNCKHIISIPEKIFLNYLNIPNTKENRQKRIGSYKVDGFDGINTIYEFLGDYYHGNPLIFNSNKINKSCKKTFGELYNKTIKKFNVLKRMGYIIKYIWENDWKNWNKLKIGNIPLLEY